MFAPTFAFPSPSIASFVDATEQPSDASPIRLKETKKMEGAKFRNAKPVNTNSVRAPLQKAGHKPKAEKLVCRYCGSDDLAPSFIKRRDRRCRKCFSKRYGSAARGKKVKAKK
jgi:hypothetical protein